MARRLSSSESCCPPSSGTLSAFALGPVLDFFALAIVSSGAGDRPDEIISYQGRGDTLGRRRATRIRKSLSRWLAPGAAGGRRRPRVATLHCTLGSRLGIL